jgi:carboxyl-terminal processing protease
MGKRVIQLLAGFLLVAWISGWIAPSPAYALTSDQKLVSDVWRIINRAYLDESFNRQNWWLVREQFVQRPLNSRADAYQAIRDMLALLNDPYTRLLPPEQYRSLQTTTSGELTGVGLQIAKDETDQALVVVAPVEGSPAAAAQIQPRDRILAIDGHPTPSLTLDEAANLMRGSIGTQVTLTMERLGQAPEVITLTRNAINLNPVITHLEDVSEDLRIGYLRLTQFNGNAPAEIAQTIQRFEAEGVDAYILDLRNNPGGLLSAGIEVAREWLEQGTIVYTVDRRGVLDSYEANGTALTTAPLMVLVNEGTASASEILAGALQDNHRAELIGTVTFGKGLIQSLFDLADGSGLAVTVAKYETPAHHDINRSGIRPDYRVMVDAMERQMIGTQDDVQYQAAIALLKARTVVAEAA